MPKIIKEQTGEASVVITETFIDEEAALDKEAEPETTDVKVTDLKIQNTKWRKHYDE
jgi:hypothetical protein